MIMDILKQNPKLDLEKGNYFWVLGCKAIRCGPPNKGARFTSRVQGSHLECGSEFGEDIGK